jgi:hypothetical protein
VFVASARVRVTAGRVPETPPPAVETWLPALLPPPPHPASATAERKPATGRTNANVARVQVVCISGLHDRGIAVALRHADGMKLPINPLWLKADHSRGRGVEFRVAA